MAEGKARHALLHQCTARSWPGDFVLRQGPGSHARPPRGEPPPCVAHHGQLWDVGWGRRAITRRNNDTKHLLSEACLRKPGVLQARERASPLRKARGSEGGPSPPAVASELPQPRSPVWASQLPRRPADLQLLPLGPESPRAPPPPPRPPGLLGPAGFSLGNNRSACVTGSWENNRLVESKVNELMLGHMSSGNGGRPLAGVQAR